ncbi:hypothetical protein EG68_01871 [Paragonimus skrjabini miyazakii]|uniref:Leishmanolysin-like peptidase n=1 Tax=Paragonimus skrjabini miyazakii TaxID=59628 RepID=A0A8S9Z055_9TREM|nr:hypothetical protein EG68_01871 [Paragonimus skrjabini miyazakii]
MTFNTQCVLMLKYFVWGPFILSCGFTLALKNHKCWVPPNNTIRVAPNKYTISALKSAPENLRITMTYTERMKRLSSFSLLQKELLEPAVAFWSKTLRVKNPLSEPIFFGRTCVDDAEFVHADGQTYCSKGCKQQTLCNTEPIPEEYLSPCMEIRNGRRQIGSRPRSRPSTADILLIVDADANNMCKAGFLGFAMACQVDRVHNRPILGYVNLCSSAIVSDSGLNELAYSTFVHEIAHSLGFLPSLYAFLRDENGEPRTRRNPNTQLPDLGVDSNGLYIPDKTTLDTVDRTWKSAKGTFIQKIKVLKTPMLLETAREHFNCPTLDGVDLENQGSEFTAGAHFEKRLVMNELMSGSITGRSVVSKLTLAFFYDSGWYDVDMSQAEPLTWGRNLGCDFVLKSCYEYMEIQKRQNVTNSPWCNEVTSSTQCLPDKNAFGSCDLNKVRLNLEPQYQYFNKLENVPDDQLSHYGGTNAFADYCPMGVTAMPTMNSNITALIRSALITIQKPHGCPHDIQFCHKYICSDTEGLLLIFAGTYFKCPLHGGSIHIDTVNSYHHLTGNATCPQCYDVCQHCPHEQQVHGDSTNGKRLFPVAVAGCALTLLTMSIFLQLP